MSPFPGISRGYGYARLKTESGKIDIEKYSDYDLRFQAFRLSSTDSESTGFWICYKLLEVEKQGGVCVPQGELEEFLLSKNSKDEEIESAVIGLPIVVDNRNYYLARLHSSEKSIINSLKLLSGSSIDTIDNIFTESFFSEEQKNAVKYCLNNSISLLTGGPGTGKTTIIKSILKTALVNGISPKNIKTASPTGKASKRLYESAREIFDENPEMEKPLTIHRLLGYNPSTGKCRFNEENPLITKLLIVDESSMIDIFLMEALLNAVPREHGLKIIFSGDPNQLLSVDSGMIFSDLVQAKLNVFHLSQTFRQSSEGSKIRKIAQLIEKNEVPDLDEFISLDKDISLNEITFIDSDEENANELLFNWYSKIESDKKQILTPYNDGVTGVDGINSYFINLLFPNATPGSFPNSIPVIATRNMNDIGIFNGETARLFNSDNVYEFVETGKAPVEIPFYLLSSFKPAYSITIHKSQGSEYDHVCLILSNQDITKTKSKILNKRLIYTAITRAKISLTIIGKKQCWEDALRKKEIDRYSGIVQKLL